MGYKLNVLSKFGLQWIDTARNLILDRLSRIQNSDTEPNGYNREVESTLPMLEFCENAASGTYQRYDQAGNYSEITGATTFGDNVTPLADYTVCTRPNTPTNSTFTVWVQGIEYIKVGTETFQVPSTIGVHPIVYDIDGNLKAASSIHEAIVLTAITSIVYCDGAGNWGLFADERHGKSQSGIDHERLHTTLGAVYASPGLGFEGLVDAQETYSQITSGTMWDEDKKANVLAASTHRFIYRLGAEGRWVWSDADNRLAMSPSRDNTTNAYWNRWTGTEWVLELSTSATDYIPYYALYTNNKGGEVVKVLGQSAFPSRPAARDAIPFEIQKMQLDGLPSPELKFLYSYIVRRNTDLEELAGGDLVLDYRNTTSNGIGNTSPSSVLHSDTLLRDAVDAHPIEAITNLRLELDKPKSAGIVGVVPILINNGDGTIDINACEVGLFDNANWEGNLSKYSIASQSAVTLTNLVTNYLVVNYNSGTPQYEIITALGVINESDIIPIYTIYRNGNNLSYINWDSLGQGLSNKLNARFVKTQRFGYESGFALTEKNTRELDVSAGVTWHGAVRNPLAEVDSLTDTMIFWYPVAGVWTPSTVTQYTNNQYSDGTDLQTLNPNKYTTIDVYRTQMDIEEISYVLGNTYNNVTDASNAPLANVPPQVTTLGFIVGRLIIISGGTTALEVQSAFTHKFASVPITEHNSLSGLNDGDYIHLTAAEYANLGTSAIIYKSSIWWGTLNIESEDLLSIDINSSTIYAQNAGTVTKIKFYIADLGSNPNVLKINFVIGSSDLLAVNHTVTVGWNVLTTLQNTAVAENEAIKLAVRTASGDSDIDRADVYITVE